MHKVTKVLLVSSITNIFLSIIKVTFGFIGKSKALIADGIHSFSDLATDLIAIFGSFLSLKPADKEHPFGHGKVEYITSLIIAIIIIILGLGLINNAFNKDITIPNLLIVFSNSFYNHYKDYIIYIYLSKRNKIQQQHFNSFGKRESKRCI